MKSVGVLQATTHLSRLLDEVELGHTITITRNGQPVARLTPVDMRTSADVEDAIRSWLEYRAREGITLDGLSLRELIDGGRP